MTLRVVLAGISEEATTLSASQLRRKGPAVNFPDSPRLAEEQGGKKVNSSCQKKKKTHRCIFSRKGS